MILLEWKILKLFKDFYASYYRERRVSRDEFYTAMRAKFSEYNIHADDYRMHGPGRYYGYNAFFQMDEEWKEKLTEKSGSIDLFEAFLETANSDVQK